MQWPWSNVQYSICPMYDMDSLNRSFCGRLIVEIVPCNSDIEDIGKFKRCDLDRIMTKKDGKNLFLKIFCPDIQIFYAYMRKKGATSYASEYETRSLRSPQKLMKEERKLGGPSGTHCSMSESEWFDQKTGSSV